MAHDPPVGPAAPATGEPPLLAVIFLMLEGLLGGVGGGGNREGACLLRDFFSSLRVKNERSDNVTPFISHPLADICNGLCSAELVASHEVFLEAACGGSQMQGN